MSVQICEGIWRNRCNQRLVITRCEPLGDQQWTDGIQRYSDNGKYNVGDVQSNQDLVSFIGPLPDKSQPDQTAKIELLRTTLTQQTAEIDRLRAEDAAENERLQAEWQSQFIAAQQLRSDNDRLRAEIERLRGELQQSEARNTANAEAAEYAAQLEGLLDNSREALRELQEDHTAMDHRAEGARLAFLDVIKTLWEMRR